MTFIDTSVISEVKQDMEEEYPDFIACYLDHAAGFMQFCGAAIAATDSDALHFQAHALKSSSAYVGAKELTALAAIMEKLGADGNTDGAADLNEQAAEIFATVSAELQATLDD